MPRCGFPCIHHCQYVCESHLTLSRDLAILISANANYYGPDFNDASCGEDSVPHARGTAFDKDLIQRTLVGEMTDANIGTFTASTWEVSPGTLQPTLWCGRYSVPMGMLLLRRVAAQVDGKTVIGSLLKYSDTWTEGVLPLRNTQLGTTAPFSLKHWVGFCSFCLLVSCEQEALRHWVPVGSLAGCGCEV